MLAIHEHFDGLDADDSADDLPDEVLLSLDALSDALARTHDALLQQQNRRGGAISKLLRAGPDAELLRAARDDIKQAMSIYFVSSFVPRCVHVRVRGTGTRESLPSPACTLSVPAVRIAFPASRDQVLRSLSAAAPSSGRCPLRQPTTELGGRRAAQAL